VWRESWFTFDDNPGRSVLREHGLAFARHLVMFRIGLGSLVLVSLVACDGTSSSGNFDDLASEMEGIYRVTSYTRNEAACVPGGESILGNDGFLFVTTQAFLGTKLVSAMSCSSVADCRDKRSRVAAGDGVAIDFSFAASEVGTNDTLVGQGASTGFELEDGICTGGELTTSTFRLADGGLEIDHAVTLAEDHPVDSDGFCTTTATQRAAQGLACSQMEALSADFVEAL
jgi:hypothetical protein